MTDPLVPAALDFGADAPNESITTSHLSHSFPESESSPKIERFKRIKTNRVIVDEEIMDQYLREARSKLDRLIDLVLHGGKLEHSYDAYYRRTESLCRYKHSEQSRLADSIKGKIEAYFDSNVKKSIEEALNLEELNASMQHFLNEHNLWEQKLNLLSKLLLYLDRTYLLHHSKRKTISNNGWDIFAKEILEKNEKVYIKHRQLLNKAREFEDPSDVQLANEISRILIDLNRNNLLKLQTTFMDSIISHYNVLRAKWLSTPDQYMNICFTKMSTEITTFKNCKYPSSFLKDLLLKLKWSLIFQNLQEVLKATLPFLLADNNQTQLKYIFDFCEQSVEEYNYESIPLFIRQWGDLIFEAMASKIESLKTDSKLMIPEICQLFNTFRDIASKKFKENERFEFELRSRFEKVCNQKSTNAFIITKLCKYCDSYLKSAAKKQGTKSTSFIEFQDQFLIMFKAINNKTDCLSLYKKDLSRRLLLSRSSNIVQEKKLADSMIDIMGETDDTISLKIMFKDFKTSKDLFFDIPHSNPSSLSFSALVLEKKHWPEIPKIEGNVILPEPLTNIIDDFTSHYHTLSERHIDQRLDWNYYTLHQLSIVSHFPNGDKELSMNLLQATVLLLFNEKDSLDLTSLIESTRFDELLLKRILSSLCKVQILLKDGERYSYNVNFTDKSYKIKIPLAKEREGINPPNAELSAVTRERSTEIQSVLVRLMKQKEKLNATQLIVEAMELLEMRGPVSIPDIKNAIENLISHEFLKRESKDVLQYLP